MFSQFVEIYWLNSAELQRIGSGLKLKGTNDVEQSKASPSISKSSFVNINGSNTVGITVQLKQNFYLQPKY